MVTGTRNTAASAGTASDEKYSALFRATRCEVGAVTLSCVAGQRRMNRESAFERASCRMSRRMSRHMSRRISRRQAWWPKARRSLSNGSLLWCEPGDWGVSGCTVVNITAARRVSQC